MTDEELRALVRAAIQRHLQPHGQPQPGHPGQLPPPGGQTVHRAHAARSDPAWRAHPSFGKFLLTRGDDEGGPCMIEPSVQCNHCGFCQSYGH